MHFSVCGSADFLTLHIAIFKLKLVQVPINSHELEKYHVYKINRCDSFIVWYGAGCFGRLSICRPKLLQSQPEML